MAEDEGFKRKSIETRLLVQALPLTSMTEDNRPNLSRHP